MNIRNITSFGSNSLGNTPIQSLFQLNSTFHHGLDANQLNNHINTRGSTKNSIFNVGEDLDIYNIQDIPSSISQHANKDSLFCVDPQGRTRRSKAIISATNSIISTGGLNKHRSNRRSSNLTHHINEPPKSQGLNIQSITQQHFLSQLSKNTSNKPTTNVLPADFLQKVFTAQNPSYNLNLLNTNPPTQISTKCQPTPDVTDNAPQLNAINSRVSSEKRQSQKEKEEIKEAQLQAMQNVQRQESKGKTLDEEDPELIQRRALLNLEHKRIQDKRKRQKKTSQERNILEAEYLKNPSWDYQKKCDLALRLGFTFSQISKWNWDRRKKDGLPNKR